MRHRIALIALALFSIFVFTSHHHSAVAGQVAAATGPTYTVVAESELGMHCIDGKDYSIFSVLPPYNTIHAQVIRKGEPPVRITTGVKVNYVAMTDLGGSINTTSIAKTNFWVFVKKLFLASPAPDTGLKGNKTQSLTPQPLTFDSKLGYWTAEGIPTVPYDDLNKRNPYPMGKVVVKDLSGNTLATTTVVFAVSDEMNCALCHKSGSDQDAMPKSGWENNPNVAKDVKLNILKLHDDHVDATPYLAQLKTYGYTYQSSLYATAKGGTPILCATCHSSNALGTPGVTGVRALTSDMHSKHGPVLNPSNGISLDNATSPSTSCYLCHPGAITKCQRGAMNKIACFDCHGNPTHVGDPARVGWLDVPACQMCHAQRQRYTTTFSSPGVWRTTADRRFATNLNVPIPGKQLFRYSKGHGAIYCTACHGAPHAEYPTLRANDNLYSTLLQGHSGKLTECNICHTNVPVSANGGPHGIHTIGQKWVGNHGDIVNLNGSSSCTYCHGASYKGTFLSATSTNRTFTIENGQTASFAAKAKVGCYDCHNGPNGG